MSREEIPIVNLGVQLDGDINHFSETILKNEIKGIQLEHVVIKSKTTIIDNAQDGFKTIYLCLTGKGNIIAENKNYELVPETIFLPNTIKTINIVADENDSLQYLKITTELTDADKIDLTEFPAHHTQTIYHTKFEDCQSYSEAIKSPNTISRTILPNMYIPRIAMGTVHSIGPDEVGAHKHPMLEQLFLGLSENQCTVYADDSVVDFPQHSLLHIPLGSRHSVSVKKDKVMYYVWMDFFLDKKGEEWLKTHMIDKVNRI